MTSQKKTGPLRLVAALRYSLAGLRDVWRNEEAFRMEAALLVASIPAAIWLGSSIGEVALLIGSVLALVVVETLNSAIEAVVDRIGPDHHDLSRLAKDLGSAAVLLTALLPTAVWAAFVLRLLGVPGF